MGDAEAEIAAFLKIDKEKVRLQELQGDFKLQRTIKGSPVMNILNVNQSCSANYLAKGSY